MINANGMKNIKASMEKEKPTETFKLKMKGPK